MLLLADKHIMHPLKKKLNTKITSKNTSYIKFHYQKYQKHAYN